MLLYIDVAEILSRYQFGLTASFHIIFPALSIGLAWFLVLIHAMYLLKREDVYYRLYKFWVSIFALTYTTGVVTGIFMSFQFGLNWSGYAEAAGPVLGTIIGLEVMTAFFLEAGFLGIMLLGWNRVSERVHFFATCMVAIGALLSATWILGANSWMHTPAGFVEENGQFVLKNFWAAVNNPSFILRYTHMIFAAVITGAMLVSGVSAHYLLRGKYGYFAKRGLSLSLGMVTIFIFLQIWIGDKVAGVSGKYQPSKAVAFEAHWDNTPSASWNILVITDEAQERNKFELSIPYLGSMYTTKTMNGVAPGIKNFPADVRPPIWPVFYSFRGMFFAAIAIYIMAAAGLYLRFARRLYTTQWFLKFCRIMAPVGAFATVCGWLTSEIGRQPWAIFNKLRTEDAMSPLGDTEMVVSIIAFVIIYSFLLYIYVYFVVQVVRRGPGDPPEPLGVTGRSNAINLQP